MGSPKSRVEEPIRTASKHNKVRGGAASDVGDAAGGASSNVQRGLQALRDDLARLAERVDAIVSEKGKAAWRRASSRIDDLVSDAQAKGREALGATREVIVELKSSDELPPLAPAARAHTDIVNELAAHGYSEREISNLVVPKRTLARRRAAGELLTVEETDKALRLKRIARLAERIFGDVAKARRWLRKPKRSLLGDAPVDYLASENGARVVEEMLGRIEHGIYA
jgi:putative toxin-antitoxin system antitoxin component (TIGR02293 family)